ncbi:V-type proton ATPase subunit G 2-like [Acanthaster planci]|uniref:V-type proton ATPase subunit G n=1 Tax=Acanthaster planci TaxID=133434 RepID=A0A8B7YNU4_ACAPL|nr:V-type proton ATPase subunit G 2-like [Acanthaster planci]
MAAQTPGIQQLLQAEKKAAERVADSRKRKNKRLKQAKEEAQEEIEKYRRQREEKFQETQANYLGTKGDQAKEVEEQTRRKISEMEMRVAKNKEQVLAQLFDLIFDIKPELHQNVRL